MPYDFNEAFRIPFEAALERLRKNLLTVPERGDFLFYHISEIKTTFSLNDEDREYIDPVLAGGKYKLGDVKVHYNETMYTGGEKPTFLKRLFGAKPTPLVQHIIQADLLTITLRPIYEKDNLVSVEPVFRFKCDIDPTKTLFTVKFHDNFWVVESMYYSDGSYLIYSLGAPDRLSTRAMAWLAKHSDAIPEKIKDVLDELDRNTLTSIANNETEVEELCKYLGIDRETHQKQD